MTCPLLDVVARREPVVGPIAAVVAHPDDETLALSVLLPLATDLTLVHVTDGGAGGSAVERREELDAALKIMGCAPRRVRLGFDDGAVTLRISAIAAALRPILFSMSVVVTHAFEGGHRDHDATAVAVARALAETPTPALFEFPIYSLGSSGLLTTRFPEEDRHALLVRLTAHEQDRKRRALKAFRSQHHVVSRFPLDWEGLRPAPARDFAAPRDPTRLLFARGDRTAEAQWRAAATL